MTSWRRGLAGIALSAGLLAGCTSGTAVEEPDPVGSMMPAAMSFLFTLASQEGTIDGIGEDTGEEVLTLTLRGVSDHATQFADRPIRQAYVLSTTDLVRRWEGWFGDAAPNAVLSFAVPGDPMPRSIVVELAEPEYDRPARTLTFAARHLHRQPDLSPSAQEQVPLPRRVPPATFAGAMLFIDSVEVPAQGGDAAPADQVPSSQSSLLPLPLTSLVPPEPVPSDPGPSASPGASGAGPTEAQRTINGCVISPSTSCVRANLFLAELAGADLRGADLSFANLSGADLTGANLAGANLTMATLTQAKLAGANLAGANLTEAQLGNATLPKADLTDASIERAFMLDVDLQGAVLRNVKASGVVLVDANLDGANLAAAFLVGAGLMDASLVRADLGFATIVNSDLTNADLVGATLSGTVFDGSRWTDGTTICGERSIGACRPS